MVTILFGEIHKIDRIYSSFGIIKNFRCNFLPLLTGQEDVLVTTATTRPIDFDARLSYPCRPWVYWGKVKHAGTHLLVDDQDRIDLRRHFPLWKWTVNNINLYSSFCVDISVQESKMVIRLEIALDFILRVILSFRSTFQLLSFSSKVKFFTEQNMFYTSDILHDFSISSF